jgi:DNA polymerase III subunit epsilon
MVPFRCDESGAVRSILPAFEALRDPGCPIPAGVTALTGIMQEIVAGRSIRSEDVHDFVKQASLVIAYNATFDRRFCETLVNLPWACSLNEVPWKEEGFEGSKLIHLANGHGLFFDDHRAVHDCLAGIEVLRRPLIRSGRIGLAVLLESARKPKWRLWAVGSPFELRGVLKARGCRWSDGSGGCPKSPWIDVPDDTRDDEVEFLHEEIYGRRERDIISTRVTAFDRYSSRAREEAKKAGVEQAARRFIQSEQMRHPLSMSCSGAARPPMVSASGRFPTPCAAVPCSLHDLLDGRHALRSLQFLQGLAIAPGEVAPRVRLMASYSFASLEKLGISAVSRFAEAQHP